ncbi:hypothetical protein [Aurantimicrobium minutum]|uniref:hypothetical protein n=1 Tax=Aurantimicrobium minutum TaxID=708131 RepID=UPI0024763207|nr:hypothetical protein [Aurantimicrobium minutum]
MRNPERTMQQIDPLAAGTSWDVSVFISISTWSFAVFVSVANFPHTSNGWLLLLSVVLFTAAIVVHLWSSAPRNAPYRRVNYSIFVFLAISAAALQIASDGHGYTSLTTMWGPVGLALMFAASSGYRSLPDQHFAGLAAVLALGTVLYLDGRDENLPFGALYYAVSGVSLIAIIVLGQASYTNKATRILRAWQKTMAESPVAPSLVGNPELSLPLTEQPRAFFLSLLESGRVTEQDIQKARSLSQDIRAQLVELSQQTWVERAGCTLHDPERVLPQLDLSAQSSISALLSGLASFGVTNIVVSLRTDPVSSKLSFVIQGTEADTATKSSKLRTDMASFLRVMYVVFEDVRFIDKDGQVNVMFYYASS